MSFLRLIRHQEEMAAYIATMSPERQEAFEIEMAQREARLSLQDEQEDALSRKLIEPLEMDQGIEGNIGLQDFDGEQFVLECAACPNQLCRPERL
jgi:hypothetical protein